MHEHFSHFRRHSKWLLRIILVSLLLVTVLLDIYSAQKKPSPLLPSVHHPLPTAFVTRSGPTLLLNGKRFRFSGANIYWLGLLETPTGVVYPSQFEVEDALATARMMGATVVRSHTLGVSVGCALCLEPVRDTFNQTAFQHIDYAIQAAARYSMRLIIPLVDNWHYYHGGKHTFTDWLGLADENMFYSHSQAITDFQHYLSTLLNHVNAYTGVAYKDDPTILAWELGNELRAPLEWEQIISSYIKGIDAHHLIENGNYNWQSRRELFVPELSLPSIDIYTGHYYPPSVTDLQAQATLAYDAEKSFIAEEYDWNTHSGDSLGSFLLAIEQSSVSGDLYWSLFPHDDSYGYVPQNEHFTLHYPGNTSEVQARVSMLRVHAYALRKLSPPANDVPRRPLITAINQNKIYWRGAAGAASYTIERSISSPSGPWLVLCDRCATDNDAPWTDLSQPGGQMWYRIRASSTTGVYGAYSDTYTIFISHDFADP